jgi:hypothetical protein
MTSHSSPPSHILHHQGFPWRNHVNAQNSRATRSAADHLVHHCPGRDRGVGPTTTPTHIPSSAIKNGNLTFTTNPAVLSAPSTVTGAEAGCPNSHWTGVNPTLTVTSITLTISQGGTTLFTCTASNPNGLSGTVPLAC